MAREVNLPLQPSPTCQLKTLSSTALSSSKPASVAVLAPVVRAAHPAVVEANLVAEVVVAVVVAA
jgi:hypothetical protein